MNFLKENPQHASLPHSHVHTYVHIVDFKFLLYIQTGVDTGGGGGGGGVKEGS